MNWIVELQNWGVALLIAGALYAVAGPIFRSMHPTGMLNWQGRRWRRGVALLVLLCLGLFDVRFHFERGHIGIGLAVFLWVVLGGLTAWLFGWWWQDWQREGAAREALVQKLHQEGRERELVAPPMSLGKKAWRWVINGYAVFLVAAGLYALVRYLLMKY